MKINEFSRGKAILTPNCLRSSLSHPGKPSAEVLQFCAVLQVLGHQVAFGIPAGKAGQILVLQLLKPRNCDAMLARQVQHVIGTTFGAAKVFHRHVAELGGIGNKNRTSEGKSLVAMIPSCS